MGVGLVKLHPFWGRGQDEVALLLRGMGFAGATGGAVDMPTRAVVVAGGRGAWPETGSLPLTTDA